MSLRVWLPLNGDLRNQGLDEISVTNSGAVVDNSGKIGKCYSFDGTNDYITLVGNTFPNTLSGDFSICFWILSSTDGSRDVYFGNYGISGSGNWFNLEKSASDVLRFWWNNGSPQNYFSSYSIKNADGWVHVALTRSGDDVIVYKNGSYVDTFTYSGLSNSIPSTATTFRIGGDSRTSGDLMLGGKLNDFRIYDHALSAKEIKEISKALVIHYPLDDSYSSNNLLKNGFAELGSENWDKAPNTTQIPSEDSRIKGSFVNATSKEYILIDPTHTYDLSIWIKATGASGNTYPSIRPYDIDKNFIYYYNSRVGFNTATLTTLKSPLKKGDTIIYANDLSNWSTATNNYYCRVAIFGYKDSTGHVYGDLEYTQDSPAFGTYSDKSHINKTNNTITLNKVYNGADRPAGTAICQATEGATYFYPWSTVKLENIQDWTHLTKTIVPYNDTRLKYSKYWLWYTYSNNYMAGIQILDRTLHTNTIYDCSGFGNDGTVNEITMSSESPRYDQCAVFTNANSSWIKVNENNWMAQGAPEYTINLWVNTSAWGNRIFSCTESGGFNLEGGTSGYVRNALHVYTNEAKTSTSYIYQNTELKYSDLSAGWHMITFTYDSTSKKSYIDGELHNTYAVTSYGVHFNLNARLYLGCEANTANPSAPYFEGKESDFRFYYTALSPEDIKELYEVGMSIDNKQNIHTYEIDEAGAIGISKTGILTSKTEFIEEADDPNVHLYKSGEVTANHFYEE